jgi:ATP/ADP translocase
MEVVVVTVLPGLFARRKSRMFSGVLGSFLIFFGALFFLYPESLRRHLRRKTTWKLRRYFFAIALTLGVLLISAGWRYEGLLPKVVVFVGIVALFKAVLFLNSKATEHVTAWVLERPVLHLRILAVLQIALGSAMLFGLTR